MKLKWRKVESERVFSCPYIQVDKSIFENDVGYSDEFFSLPFGDWVHVVPIFPDGRILLIELYRFGSESVSLEFPGGQIEVGMSPEEAARLELLEETGFAAQTMDYLGWSHPNPAIQANRCHFYIAKNIKEIEAQDLEPAEDISLRIVTINELHHLIKSGEVSHSLALVAYLKYIDSIKSD